MESGRVIEWLDANGWKIALAVGVIIIGLLGYALMCAAKGDDK